MKVDGWWVAFGIVAAVGLGVFAYNSNWFQDPDALRPERSRLCGSTTGPTDQRLDDCLADLPGPDPSRSAEAVIEDIAEDGDLFVAGPRLPVSGAQQLLEDSPSLREVLLATDEAAAAAALRDAGVRGFVVHRDLTNALDRDARVLSRLAQHDFLQWFQLRYVTDELLVYTVRSSPTRIPLATGQDLLEGLRARLEGRPVIPRQRWQPGAIRIIGTMRLQGRTLAMRHSAGSDIEAVLNDLAAKLRRRWDREVAVLGVGRLRERLDDVRLEVHVVMERAPVEPRDRYAIFELWELGVDGMMFRQREGVEDEKFTYMPGSKAVTLSIRSPDAFLRHAAETHGWHDLRPWEKDPRTQLDIIRTQHFMEERAGGGRAVRLFRGMPEVTMEEVTDDALRQMLVDGAEWWLTNQKADGSFVYKYWPTQNRFSTEYNEVRHILAPRDLSDAWRYRHDDRYLAGARLAMDWLLQYEVDHADPEHPRLPHPPVGTMLFRYPLTARGRRGPNQKLGTVAVALLGWVAWAESTGSDAEDERIRRMARFVLSQKEASGKFDPYYVNVGHPYFGQKNDIVPGEAALALGEVADYFDEPGWLDFYEDFLDYYQPWFHSRAEKTIPTGRWPHGTYANETRLDLVQFGPWSVMASKQYYLLTGDERAAEFGLEIADWMIDYYQWTTDRSPWPDYVGGYYKIPTELPAMQTFCYSEGTAAAYHIAARYAPERKDKYDDSTRQALRFLRVMQYDDVDSYFTPEPGLLHGGIKYAMNENKVRIDYVGHGLSTVSQYLDARDFDPAVELELTPWEELETAPREPYVPDPGADDDPDPEVDDEE